MSYHSIIKKPIITEKSLKDASFGVYTFETDLTANKHQIKKAVEEMFGVTVKGVTTVIIKGKKRQIGKKRIKVKQQDRKKARVSIGKDERIELFDIEKQT